MSRPGTVDLDAFRLSPRDVILSAPLPVRVAGPVAACRLELPPDSDGGVSWESLAHFVLGQEERPQWDRLTAPKRRREWLAGRVAAKDAIRRLLLATRGVSIFPADIAIVPEANGRPRAEGKALSGLGLSISIAHTDGVAVAIAAALEGGVGIDVERVDRRRGEYERAAFSADEVRLLGPETDLERRERSLRLWCAKEAVAKALGRGLMGSPLNLEARRVDAGFGEAELWLAGSLARALPDLTESPQIASMERHGDLIVATATALR
jgi:phosphopantetheinyl transferase